MSFLQIEEYADLETLSRREKNRLEIDLLKLESDLEVAENYHKKAEKALESLWSEITYYLAEETALGAVEVVAVAAGAYVGAGKQLISNQIGIVLWNSFI